MVTLTQRTPILPDKCPYFIGLSLIERVLDLDRNGSVRSYAEVGTLIVI